MLINHVIVRFEKKNNYLSVYTRLPRRWVSPGLADTINVKSILVSTILIQHIILINFDKYVCISSDGSWGDV